MSQRLNWLEVGLVTLGMALLGMILGAALNSGVLKAEAVPSWIPAALFGLCFLAGRIWWERARRDEGKNRLFNLALMVVAALCLISIPFFFWGVFLKLIHTADSGGAAL